MSIHSTLTLHVVLGLFIIASVSTIVTGFDDHCHTEISSQEFGRKDDYFHYCYKNAGALERVNTHENILCKPDDKIKIIDFKAFVPRNPSSKKCALNKFYYRKMVNTSCLSKSRRDTTILPFLKALSGKTARTLRLDDPEISFPTDVVQYPRIALDAVCETEGSYKMDMCKPGSKLFTGLANISLFFNSHTFNVDSNQSSCYCYFQTNSSSQRVSARAYDIRLHPNNQLYLNNAGFSSQRMYWWQTGLLAVGLQTLKMSGLGQNNLPESVWIDIYGENVNITCDIKQVNIKIVTNRPGEYSSVSEGSFGGKNILFIILGIVGVFVFVLIVVGCFKSRSSKNDRSGNYKVEDPDASEIFLSTFDNGERSQSPDQSIEAYGKSDEAVLYAKPGKSKKLQGKIGSPNQFYQLEADTDTDQDQSDAEKDEVIDTEHRISNHAVVIHKQPKEGKECDKESIYNKFQDQPDVVPSSPSTNIYDTTASGVYSSFQTQRQLSTPNDPIYS